MTKNLLLLAKEAGFEELFPDSGDWVCFSDEIERFAELVRAEEREECAKVVEESPSYDWHRFACEAAAAIRARGQE